jgi:sec-independent protein translocase protein TatA
MRDLLQPMHLLVILGVFVMLFGGKRIAEMGKGLGQGIREFRKAGRELVDAQDEIKKDA